VLPVIGIPALATIGPPFPPYTNTASVAITSSSGYVDTVPSNNSSTVTVSKPAGCPTSTPIDVAIDKEEDFSGSLGHPVINIYIINVGPPITFGPGQLTVTESIPAGYTVTSINAPNWTCSPTSLVGAGTVTCTYNVGGSLATSVGLTDSITIDGMLTDPGPLRNCATVTVGASMGVDSNLANNTVCRPIGEPVRTCDPATTTTRGAECACRYPNMVRTSKRACMCLSGGTFVDGRGCISRLECAPPLVPNAAGTDCVCPKGTEQKGKECVRVLDCRAPWIPNASRTDCICRNGFVEKGRECVRPVVCKAPAKLNRRGECECPTNMVAKGKTCVPRERQGPSVTPGDIIKMLPGGSRDKPSDPGRGKEKADTPGRR
jgi:hypothetical protein